MIRASLATGSLMAISPAHRATAIWLVPASGRITASSGGPFAIQGARSLRLYLEQSRHNKSTIGEGGALGIFTIAPTIKPRGGFHRPEIRLRDLLPSGLTSSRAPLVARPTPTETTVCLRSSGGNMVLG